MELQERIALARKQAGLSQEQLGEKLGVSRQAVSKWESGQSNPDLTYVAEMCRLFGVSSDWLLLGEEGARESAPARCPGCEAIVTGLDNFCPKCGYNLKYAECSTYTILFQNNTFSYGGDLQTLSAKEKFSEDSPLGRLLTVEEAQVMVSSAPFIIERGLSLDKVREILDTVYNPENFPVYRDCDGGDVQTLLSHPPVSSEKLKKPKEPLSFGQVALAAGVGIIGAILVLSFL